MDPSNEPKVAGVVKTPVFLVVAFRYGTMENTFPIGVCTTIERAETIADKHRAYRGRKYAHRIYPFIMDKWDDDIWGIVNRNKCIDDDCGMLKLYYTRTRVPNEATVTVVNVFETIADADAYVALYNRKACTTHIEVQQITAPSGTTVIKLPDRPSKPHIIEYELVKFPEGWVVAASTLERTANDLMTPEATLYAETNGWTVDSEQCKKHFYNGSVTVKLSSNRTITYSYGPDSEHSCSSTRYRLSGDHETPLSTMMRIDNNSGRP